MWAFRVAISSLTTGLVIFFLIIERQHYMDMLIHWLRDPEFWVALGLLAVILIFIRLRVPKMIGKMLDDRAGAISHELSEARRLREEAAALLAGYQQKAAQAEHEASAILAEAKAEAERYAKETRATLRQQIDRRAQMAKEKIEQAETAALEEIRALAADKATAAAEKLIAARLDETRSDALVQDSIKDLPENLN
jgi:F-type H+-transporting ATPase subunit b